MASRVKKYIRRSVKDISRLLEDQTLKGYQASDFCSLHGVSKQTYYNWRKRYQVVNAPANDFITIQPASIEARELIPFCDITISGSTAIRFYQPVEAKFIKALNLY